jgi:tryptophan-rich sensory protein
MRWIYLAAWMVLCFAVAAISGRWTAKEIPLWYATLDRPAISPPNWVFGPVWTLLYALMAIAAWRISLAPTGPTRTAALALFLLQLALNFAWSWIFFGRHRIGWAFAEVLLLWVAIAASAAVFARIDGLAAWLMIPYLAWVSFASVLNCAYWRLNPGR